MSDYDRYTDVNDFELFHGYEKSSDQLEEERQESRADWDDDNDD